MSWVLGSGFGLEPILQYILSTYMFIYSMDSTIGPVCPSLGETWPTISPRVTSMWQLLGESPYVMLIVSVVGNVCCQYKMTASG